ASHVSPFSTRLASPRTSENANAIAPPVPSGAFSREYDNSMPCQDSPQTSAMRSPMKPVPRIARRIPCAASTSSIHARNGRPPTGASGLGTSLTTLLNRVPKPPARIMASSMLESVMSRQHPSARNLVAAKQPVRCSLHRSRQFPKPRSGHPVELSLQRQCPLRPGQILLVIVGSTRCLEGGLEQQAGACQQGPVLPHRVIEPLFKIQIGIGRLELRDECVALAGNDADAETARLENMRQTAQTISNDMAAMQGIEITGILLEHVIRHAGIEQPQRVRAADLGEASHQRGQHLRRQVLHHFDAHPGIEETVQASNFTLMIVRVTGVFLGGEQFHAMETLCISRQ